ncbi:MAG: efflux RND transporter periplasmic adaptor subunit [Longimicrobiales bacterium]|nr:efflux RND transporter periplasmic adaptor subunit [Longimicrobiales bacterium]
MTGINRLVRSFYFKILLLFWVFIYGCGGSPEAEYSIRVKEQGILIEGSARLVNVEALRLDLQSFTEMINLTGVAVADQDVTISAQESGVVLNINLEKGSSVVKDQKLFKIDDQILKNQVGEARAAANLAKETWARRKNLFEDDQVGSELAYLQAKYAAEQADARLAILQVRLANTVIRAPIDGVLEDRMVEVGTMVNIGRDVGRIVSLSPIKVVAGVPERYALDVSVGTRAIAIFDVLGLSSEGVISYVGATVDPSNRTFKVELEMDNPNAMIKPEMIANVNVVRKSFVDVIVIPQEALVRTENGYVVYLVDRVDREFRAVSRPVKLGPSQENRVVIESGLNAGEQLIVVGQTLVSNGDIVNIVGN